ncbi:hypothetical protein B566_EDAN004318 [Ephemera danica]|nr:hypothetical protein B566_EDAN004318 [Ephemera danica]
MRGPTVLVFLVALMGAMGLPRHDHVEDHHLVSTIRSRRFISYFSNIAQYLQPSSTRLVSASNGYYPTVQVFLQRNGLTLDSSSLTSSDLQRFLQRVYLTGGTTSIDPNGLNSNSLYELFQPNDGNFNISPTRRCNIATVLPNSNQAYTSTGYTNGWRSLLTYYNPAPVTPSWRSVYNRYNYNSGYGSNYFDRYNNHYDYYHYNNHYYDYNNHYYDYHNNYSTSNDYHNNHSTSHNHHHDYRNHYNSTTYSYSYCHSYYKGENEALMQKMDAELEKRTKSFDRNMQHEKKKWQNIVERHKEKIGLIAIKREIEQEYLEKNKELVDGQRRLSTILPAMSQEALIEEKRKKYQVLRALKSKVIQRIEDDRRKKVEQQLKWNYVFKELKSMNSQAKEEERERKMREFAEIVQMRKRIHEQMLAERERKKQEDKEWLAKMEQQRQEELKKLRKKRKAKIPSSNMFASRFIEFQYRAKEREQKEREHLERIEEARAEERQKLKDAELQRRLQEKLEKPQIARMELERKQFCARSKIQEAKKKQWRIMSKGVRDEKKRQRKAKEELEKQKLEYERQRKIEEELMRRDSVSKALSKYRNEARLLAFHRAQELASKEVEEKARKEHYKAYDRWARQQWSKRLQKIKKQQEATEMMKQELIKQEKRNKVNAELERRCEVESRIEFRSKILGEREHQTTISSVVSNSARRHVLNFEQREHERRMWQAQERRTLAALHVKQQAEQEYQQYIQDREDELRHFKESRMRVLAKPTKKSWR